MTDTHVQKTMESCAKVRAALELFKAQGCEMVVNCGDIADRFYPQWYDEVCKLRERVFGDPKSARRSAPAMTLWEVRGP